MGRGKKKAVAHNQEDDVAEPVDKGTMVGKRNQGTSREEETGEEDTQFHVASDHMIACKLWEEWTKLPRARDHLTFWPNDPHPNTDALFQRKMFLGSNKGGEVWAYLHEREDRDAEVHLFAETTGKGGTSGKLAIGHGAWKKLPFMYPFEFLRTDEAKESRAQLDVLIHAYYLEAKQIPRVWAGDAKRPLNLLEQTIEKLSAAYNNYPGGK